MTMITVRALEGAIDLAARAELAQSLTDAVLSVELGQFVEAARSGFQVQFLEVAADSAATHGQLCSVSGANPIYVDVAVMDAAWTQEDRAAVIEGVLLALAIALDRAEPDPLWWVNFRLIAEGSWGSRGGVTSILSFVDLGVFSPAKVAAIRAEQR